MDRITLIALLFSATGCVPIDGGAVEASWVVTTHDGRGIANCGCTCPPIAKIRLQLMPTSGGSDPCAGRTACEFSCNLQSGATRFDIPPGSYAIALVPVGADGNDITNGEVGTCSAGSPVAPRVREVIKGRVTQLDAILMESDCAADCGGSDNHKVCTK
ncbi:MAG TPA: hypothetical protein VF518_06225 [Polyangia bacterium]